MHITDDGTYLQLADKPLPLPPRLAVLLIDLGEQQRANQHPGPGKPVLLFPGLRRSRAVHPKVLLRQLHELGSQAQASRNSARAALAEDLPAPVLAELTGLSITAAIRWAKHVNRSWQPYLAARIDQS